MNFILFDATIPFQNCLIEIRIPSLKQYNTITAQHKELENSTTGIMLQNCTIKAM